MKCEYLLSERLDYCPLEKKHIDEFVEFRNEKSYRKWFGFQPATTHVSAIQEINAMQRKGTQEINILKESLDLGLFLKTTGEFVGTVSLNKFHGPDDELEYVEVGFGVAESHQNKGYATEATKTVVKWGLKKLRGLQAEARIAGIVEHGNIASTKVLANSGFIHVETKEYVHVYALTAELADA